MHPNPSNRKRYAGAMLYTFFWETVVAFWCLASAQYSRYLSDVRMSLKDEWRTKPEGSVYIQKENTKQMQMEFGKDPIWPRIEAQKIPGWP